MRRFEIRHIRRGASGEEHKAIPTPTLVFPTMDGARYAFDRYCDEHLGPDDVADLLDDRGRIIRTRNGG